MVANRRYFAQERAIRLIAFAIYRQSFHLHFATSGPSASRIFFSPNSATSSFQLALDIVRNGRLKFRRNIESSPISPALGDLSAARLARSTPQNFRFSHIQVNTIQLRFSTATQAVISRCICGSVSIIFASNLAKCGPLLIPQWLSICRLVYNQIRASIRNDG